ncbi:Homogentisate prenyltransferase isoform 1 [Hibiscus syriacus]|uniref:Homogentisate prenyltransferase isoform 1 n=1 Tax=Hibiscus syriacus TaxID=106335 RepID=A0A6A3BMH7_HIBSY|nr:Homogentisate prenyltransferase isoform 1 [Hibiscus syriacus]
MISNTDIENEASVTAEICENVNDNDTLQTPNGMPEKESHSDLSDVGGRQYQAALKLQKVYKSFRTRRQLADCAVVVEQKWWKLLDFVELKRSSISFFEIERPESAVSRWFRARIRAAKVGKGLSQDEKARKLALQHWLEAIDPRHRYGHNLQFYYAKWLHCESKEPFFYWLDIGEGREVHLESCPRSKLQQQCIKYLGPAERNEFEVVVRDKKLVHKQSGDVVDTAGGPENVKWIFVLSATRKLYVGQKNKGNFQHSSFLAGGATLAAGRLVAEKGVLKAIWPHSGHYLPTEENFQEFLSFLQEHNVDLTDVKKSPTEDDQFFIRKNSCVASNETTQGDSQQTEAMINENSAQENKGSTKEDEDAAQNSNKTMSRLFSKISNLQIQKIHDVIEILKTKTLSPRFHREHQTLSPKTQDGYASAEESLSEEELAFTKINLLGEDDDEEDRKSIPKEKILRRIDSHKVKSYQLAQQLSSKWCTGAGARISCMRDYPSELQFRVLEKVNLSPRSRNVNASPRTNSRFSPTVLTPTSACTPSKSPLGPRTNDSDENNNSLGEF